MANKRVSELAPIYAADLVAQDLLLLSDVSSHESKKLELTDLSSYLLSGGNLSGSFYGTASYALNVLNVPTQVSCSYASTSSWAINAITASSALAALSASYANSGSYVLTASYAFTSSAQTALSAANATLADTASFLYYNGSRPNGTASYALFARSASAVNGGVHGVGKITGTGDLEVAGTVIGDTAVSSPKLHSAIFAANYAVVANSSLDLVSIACTSQSLVYLNGVTSAVQTQLDSKVPLVGGTASYALNAGSTTVHRIDFGVHPAISQSTGIAQLDMVTIYSNSGGNKSSSFEACGTAILPYTSSALTNGLVSLIATNRTTGVTASLDSTPITAFVVGGGDGIMKVPFTLMGEAPLDGDYLVRVSASAGVLIEPSRTVRFDIVSLADSVTVYPAELTNLYAFPENTLLVFSSSLAAAQLSESASAIVASGSQYVTNLRVAPAAISDIRYLWTLNNLVNFECKGNTGLISIGGIPSSLVTMSVESCSLSTLPPMQYSSVKVLKCGKNSLSGSMEGKLPGSMRYLDCSQNVGLTVLQRLWPSDLEVVLANSTSMITTPDSMPNSILTMSIANCTSFTSWNLPTYPTGIVYFDCHNTALTQLPSPTADIRYMDVSNCQLTPTTIGYIGSQLVTNGLLNGVLKIAGNSNSSSAPSILASVASLRGNGWVVDGA